MVTRSGQWRPLTPRSIVSLVRPLLQLVTPRHHHRVNKSPHTSHSLLSKHLYISCFCFFVTHCEDEFIGSITIRQLMQLEYDDSHILMWHSAVLDNSAGSQTRQ